MSTFDEREKGFEAKFKHDAETLFRIHNRRNKLLGLWAAELMSLKGAEAEEYAKTVVAADFEKPGDDDVHDKVEADLKEHKVDLSDHMLRRKMNELLEVARQQILKEA